VQDSLQSSGTQGICYRNHTSHPHVPEGRVLTPDRAGRCPRSSARQEELPHNSRPFFTPRRTPSQLEALLHSTKNSHTYRGPSSCQEELPHYSRPFFTPERLPVCTRPLIHEQSACKTPHVTTDIRKTILTAKEQQHQSSSSSNCLCKHKHVAQSKSHFRSTLAR
jgi:hypothetical protein